jgi:hypothetical protein
MPHKLNNAQRTHVVRRLAAYDKPTAIAHDLKELFGVTISTQAIEHYDPERPAGQDLAPQWREIFRAARKAYIAEMAAMGQMEKLVRMLLRQRMAISAFENDNYKLANEILDSIAKEAGHAFDGRNRHEQFGAGGIQPSAIITITRPAEAEPAPEAAHGVREPRD